MSDYGPTWDQLRSRVFRRDSYQCVSCGRRGGPRGDAQLHPHHVQSKSRGGSDDLSNLVTLCDQCHDDRHPQSDLQQSDRRRRRRARGRGRKAKRINQG